MAHLRSRHPASRSNRCRDAGSARRLQQVAFAGAQERSARAGGQRRVDQVRRRVHRGVLRRQSVVRCRAAAGMSSTASSATGRRKAFRRRSRGWSRSRQRAVGFQDSTLSPEERFQRDYVISRIDNDLFWLRDARQPFTNPELVLQQRARSEHVRHRAVCAGRSAAARVHQVRAADSRRGGADQEEPADAAAEDVPRLQQQELRRLRRFLSQRRAAGVRGSAGRGAEEAAAGGHRAGREGDAGFRQVAGGAEARQERRVRARAGALRGDGAHDGERHDAGRQARRDRPRRPGAQSRGARRRVQAVTRRVRRSRRASRR